MGISPYVGYSFYKFYLRNLLDITGDITTCYADATKTKEETLRDKCGLEQMCVDSWSWQKNNSNVYI